MPGFGLSNMFDGVQDRMTEIVDAVQSPLMPVVEELNHYDGVDNTDILPVVQAIFSDLNIDGDVVSRQNMQNFLGQVLDDVYNNTPGHSANAFVLNLKNIGIIRGHIINKYRDYKNLQLQNQASQQVQNSQNIKNYTNVNQDLNTATQDRQALRLDVVGNLSGYRLKYEEVEGVYKKNTNSDEWNNFLSQNFAVVGAFDRLVSNNLLERADANFLLEYRFAGEMMAKDLRDRGVSSADVSPQQMQFLESVNDMSLSMGLEPIDLNFGGVDRMQAGAQEQSLEAVTENEELDLDLSRMNDSVASFAQDRSQPMVSSKAFENAVKGLDDEILDKMSVMVFPQVKDFIKTTFDGSGLSDLYTNYFDQMDSLKFDNDGVIKLPVGTDMSQLPNGFNKVLSDLSTIVKNKFLSEQQIARFQDTVLAPTVDEVAKEKAIGAALQGVTRYFDAFHGGLDLDASSFLDLRNGVRFDPDNKVLEFQIENRDNSLSLDGVQGKMIKFRYDIETGEMMASDFFARKKTIDGKSRVKDSSDEDSFEIGSGQMEKIPVSLPKWDKIEQTASKEVLKNIKPTLKKMEVPEDIQETKAVFKEGLSKEVGSVADMLPQKSDYNEVVLQHVMQKNLLAGFQQDIVAKIWGEDLGSVEASDQEIYRLYEIFDACSDYYTIDEMVKFKGLLDKFIDLINDVNIQNYMPGQGLGNQYALGFAKMFNNIKLGADRDLVKNNGENLSLSAFFESVDLDRAPEGQKNVVDLDDLQFLLEQVAGGLYMNGQTEIEVENETDYRCAGFLLAAEDCSADMEADGYLDENMDLV